MRIAITGGTGFVGRHLARELVAKGHEIVLIARRPRDFDPSDAFARAIADTQFVPSDLSDADELARAFSACGAVAHCAGINREIDNQTYRRVHIAGTRNIVEACRRAGVGKLTLMSFLRARPNCGSGYHESKWAAEQIVRDSKLDYTIFKAGVVYGRGDHMLDHLSHALYTFPMFALVGLKDQLVRPLAVSNLTHVMAAALTEGRLSRQTVAITGPETLSLQDAVRRVGDVIGKHPLYVRMPVAFHYFLGAILEKLMTVPMVSLAQVRILSEGIVKPWPPFSELPPDLAPETPFTHEQIRRGLPEPGAFGWRDLRCCA